MPQQTLVEECNHPHRMDALQFKRNSKIGIGWSNEGWKHLYGCDTCYKELESFYGKIQARLMVSQPLKEAMQLLKDANYKLSDKEFEMLHIASTYIATTVEETENIRDRIVPDYKLLVKRLEEHLASAPS